MYYPTLPYCTVPLLGIGKTSAVIESILQMSIKNPALKILACAPSDAAADVIIEREFV